MRISSTFKMVCFCIFLVVVRILITGHLSFIFLIWNLFLAWLPYYFIRKYYKLSKKTEQFFILGLTVLFLPNAPYIITDLFHLSKNLVAPQWFDLILILSFSISGLIYFIKTCEQFFIILKDLIRSAFCFQVTRILLIISNGYGIYLGRYLRFNSWDLITDPGGLAEKILISLFHPGHFKETFAMTLTFAVFLYLILELYESFKKNINAGHELHEGP